MITTLKNENTELAGERTQIKVGDIVESINPYHQGLKFRVEDVIPTARGNRYECLRLSDTKTQHGFDAMRNEFLEDEIKLWF